ncbi:hypothetical protein Taro_014204, partial [Colocasia esculenta]|nr:hypothetical protein [Colocasia esculenta]
ALRHLKHLAAVRSHGRVGYPSLGFVLGVTLFSSVSATLYIVVVLKTRLQMSLTPLSSLHTTTNIFQLEVLLQRRYALEEWMGKLLSDIDLSRSVHVASFLELEAAARSYYGSDNACETSEAESPRHEKEFPKSMVQSGIVLKEALLSGERVDELSNTVDQRHKLNRILLTMQRRLVTAKTDMEDLIARLNQEIAVKEYLTTKVKDLEGELESTRQKGKENLQQALLVERERVTQMQWDMDELQRMTMEMESRLNCEQNDRIRAESEKLSAIREKEMLMQDFDAKKEQLASLQKHLEEVEIKSKGDIKVLVKEVKSLRNSQAELKEMLNQSVKGKKELEVAGGHQILVGGIWFSLVCVGLNERVLQKEKQRWEDAKVAKKKILHECGILRHRLEDCSVNLFAEEEDKFTVNSSSLPDALDLLTTSDNRIGLLLAESLDFVRASVSISLGDGQRCSFWTDRWCGDLTLDHLFLDLFAIISALTATVADFFDSQAAHREDQLSWRWEKSGRFSVKSAYLMLVDGGLRHEAQLLARDDENALLTVGKFPNKEHLGNMNGEDPRAADDEMRKMLSDVFIDNARLRKQVNSVTRCALKTVVKVEKEDSDGTPVRKTVLTKLLER